MSVWNERYSGEEYFYGTEPNAFLVSQKSLLKSGASCLAVADGEGRNGVWLAEQGLDVLSLDASPVAQAKAKRLAQTRGVAMRFEQADLLSWRSDERFDLVAAIFIQFVGPDLRPAQFENLKRHLKPAVFKKLSPEILQRHAAVFAISVEDAVAQTRAVVLPRKIDVPEKREL